MLFRFHRDLVLASLGLRHEIQVRGCSSKRLIKSPDNKANSRTIGWLEATRGKSRDRKFPTRFLSTGKLSTVSGFQGNKSPRSHDTPIPGYNTKNCISLRLWDAQPIVADFNLSAFNESDYKTAMGPTNLAQQMMAVLYPGDATNEGKALRLSQQYMLCSASVQDILARFKEREETRIGTSCRKKCASK